MYFRSQIFTYLIILLLGFNIDTIAQKSLDKYQNNFQNPPTDCWPHTRWWWPGNAMHFGKIFFYIFL